MCIRDRSESDERPIEFANVRAETGSTFGEEDAERDRGRSKRYHGGVREKGDVYRAEIEVAERGFE